MRPLTIALLSACITAAGCSAEQADAPEEGPEQMAAADPEVLGEANLSLADGSEAGSASLVKTDERLEMRISLTGLEPGEHAFHLHTTGLCEGPDFTSAGGHLNPQDNTHGSLSEGGRHLGDLPNITVSEDGSLTQTITLDWAGPDSTSAIFDEDGSAVMIHEGPDDYMTDPAGAAGSRIACGVLTQTAS